MSVGLIGSLAIGCDAGETSEVQDTVTQGPFDPNTGECATNWRVMDRSSLGDRALVENERLILRSKGETVSVQGLLGVPSGGRGEVLRFEFRMMDLGADGRFTIEMVAPEGTVATLAVDRARATLATEAGPLSHQADLALPEPPRRMVFELDLKADLALEARAFFFEAGRGKVLISALKRFDGGTVTNLLTLSGSAAEVQLERFARVDPGNGGLMEDFWCDSLGTAPDRFRFPEGRASKAGKPCQDEDECGAGELCVQAVCRRACLASNQCLSTVCIVQPQGGLCAPPTDSCQPTSGLACGGDGALRNACGSNRDCPRHDDLCLGGACVSNDEPWTRDGDAQWGQCEYGTQRCEDDLVEACDTTGPGWNPVEQCATDMCVSDGQTAFCDACVRSCGGPFEEDVYASCDGGPLQLLDDCEDAVEVCSLGDTASERAHCRPVLAPAPPSTAVDVGPYAIDPTEVTRAQYTAFLQSHPSLDGQSEDCAWNDTYRPHEWPWFDAPERAVQVDFCDASAYCAWQGKQLCPTENWADACSSGGQYHFPYGDEYESGRCSLDPRRDVGTNPECSADSGPYAGVYDMIGGVGEWLDACVHGPTTVREADSCKTRGTAVSQPCHIERTVRRDSIAGIRCCSL